MLKVHSALFRRGRRKSITIGYGSENILHRIKVQCKCNEHKSDVNAATYPRRV